MKKPATAEAVIRSGAAQMLQKYIENEFSGTGVLTVCDTNTEKYTHKIKTKNSCGTYVFPASAAADPVICRPLIDKILSGSDDPGQKKPGCLIACGSGRIHDITRYSAYQAGIPFISFPTAASVDGFVSGVAAMTIKGRKASLPAEPPKALFADPDVFCDAPKRLTVSGIGDVLGKFISLADWKTADAIGRSGDVYDEEIAGLEKNALKKVLGINPESDEFTPAVMEALVMCGMAMQYCGNSRPASGAEHHLSHLWEMHIINRPTGALHGEQVGVSTLLVTDLYKRAAEEDFASHYSAVDYSYEHLYPVFGELTGGIIEENTPDPTSCISSADLKAAQEKIRGIMDSVPDSSWQRDYMESMGAKTSVGQIGLPDDEEFIKKTLEYAPYVRRRITFLKLL